MPLTNFISVIIKFSNNFVTYSLYICINRMLIVILNANRSYCMLISVTHLKMKIKIKSIRNLVLLSFSIKERSKLKKYSDNRVTARHSNAPSACCLLVAY